MEWEEIIDEDRPSAILEAYTDYGIKYVISENKFHEYAEANGYVLSRDSDRFDEGYVGKINGQVCICCGNGMACAIGVHPACVYHDVKDLKRLAEEDFLCLRDYCNQ